MSMRMRETLFGRVVSVASVEKGGFELRDEEPPTKQAISRIHASGESFDQLREEFQSSWAVRV